MLFLVFASMVLQRVDRAEAESWSVEICRRWASGARDQLIVVEVILCALAEFHVGREEVVVLGGKYEQLVYLETDLCGQTEERRVAWDSSGLGRFGGQRKYIGRLLRLFL